MVEKNWVILKKGTAEQRKEIAERYNISEYTAQILLNKQIEDMDSYIHPTVLHSPWELKDMRETVNLLQKAIKNQFKIRVCGDMDVDGITSTTILVKGLTECGAVVDYDIPHRVNDGYGLNIRMVDECIQDGIKVILTCDNGIAANEAIHYAKDHDRIVIVTDHHEVPFIVNDDNEKIYVLPEADAVVNPHQIDCPYPYTGICGAMVAFKVVQAMFETYRIEESHLDRYKELAALGTVCDIMKLEDENRTIVKQGLSLMQNSAYIGLRKLIEINQIQPEKLSVFHLGFIIGPSLNSTGRLDTAKVGVSLLLEEEEAKAEETARDLKELNEVRKDLTIRSTNIAIDMVHKNGLDKVLVLYVPECEQSVAGIVAGRVREAFYRPTIILTKDKDGNLVGSGRSIEPYDMYEEINKFKDLLTKFGGHKMAAGMSLPMDNFDKFKECLNDACKLEDADFIEKLKIDVQMPFHLLTEHFIDELALFEPYGNGNPKPVIAERNIEPKKAMILGKNKNTLKIQTLTACGRMIDLMYFGDIGAMEEYYSNKYSKKDWENLMTGYDNNIRMVVTYEPSINEWQGVKNIQAIIKEYK